MKKVLAVGLILVMALSLVLSGCGQKAETQNADSSKAVASKTDAPKTDAPKADETKKLKIGVAIDNLDDKWLSYLADSFTEYAKTLPDVDLQLVDSKTDMNKQLGQVETFIAQGFDAIIVNPVTTDGSGPITDKAKAANIPIVSVNRPFKNQDDAASYCGGDSLQSGVLEMEYLAKKLNGKGNVAIMIGDPSHEAAVQRTEGFKQVLAKYPDMKVVTEQTAMWDRAKGMSLMENWLQSGKQIDVVAANNDEMAIGAIKAIEAAGKMDKIVVGGIDASPDALGFLKSGQLSVTVFQDAAGQAKGALDAAVKAAKGETVEKSYPIPYQLVAPEDADKYLQIWGK